MRISKYLIYFLPGALVSGPFLSEIVIIFVSLNFLYISFKKNLISYYQNAFSKFFLLFYFIINISSIFSGNIIYSLATSLPYCRFYLFAIAFSYIAKNEKGFLNNFYYILLFILSFVAISGYAEYLFNINFSNDIAFVKEKHRLSGLFGSELIIGSYLSRLLPLSIVLAVFLKKDNLYFIFFLIFIFFIVFLSGERTALFLAFISYITYLLFSSKSSIVKLTVVAITTLLVLYFVSTNSIIKHRLFGETKSQIYSQDKLYLFSKEHTSHYKAAIKMFIDSPLLGHGPKTFRVNCIKPIYYENIHSCTTHPHNFLLQLLAEIGIFGFSIVFLFFYSVFLCLKKIYEKSYPVYFYYLPFIVFSIPFVPSGNFFNNWLSMVSYLSMSLSIYLLFFKNKKIKK